VVFGTTETAERTAGAAGTTVSLCFRTFELALTGA